MEQDENPSVDLTEPALMGAGNGSGEKSRRRDKVKRVILPAAEPGAPPPNFNLQFVQEEKKAEPKKEPRPWAEASTQAANSFERDAARLADTVTWTLERTGPMMWEGRRVPCGTFPEEYQGPITAQVLGDIGGGGNYYATFTDPDTGEPRRIGPFKIAGAPRFNIGISEEDEAAEKLPEDFRASPGSVSKDDEWVMTIDPRLGVVRRKMADIERDAREMRYGQPAAPSVDPVVKAQLDALARSQDTIAHALAELTKTIATPREDISVKFMEVEKNRIASESASKSEELRWIRDKADADRKEAEALRRHDREAAETKAAAELARLKEERQAEKERIADERRSEKERLAEEKKNFEARLAADAARLAQEKDLAEKRLQLMTESSEKKLDQANKMAMDLLKEKQNPLEQFMGMFAAVREVSDVLNPVAVVDGEPAPVRPKTIVERLVEKMSEAATKIWPTIEPAVKEKVKQLVQESRDLTAPAPKQLQVTVNPVTQPAAPAPKPAAKKSPATAPATAQAAAASDQPKKSVAEQTAEQDPITQELIVQGVGSLVMEIRASIERGLPPSLAWEEVVRVAPMIAPQLQAYKTPEQMAAELRAMAAEEHFKEFAPTLLDVAEKFVGSSRSWAEGFLAMVHAPTGGK